MGNLRSGSEECGRPCREGVLHSNLTEAEPEAELEAEPDSNVEDITHRNYCWQLMKKVRDLPLLLVYRQRYNESIPLFYQLNRFGFTDPQALVTFANGAWRMGNHGYISQITINLDLWDCDSRSDDWEAFLEDEERGLLWYLPGLKELVLNIGCGGAIPYLEG